MKIMYSPQMRVNEKINYVFQGDKITASYNGITDEFDFTGMPDGELAIYDTSVMPCIPLFKTTLEFLPIISANKKDGILSVTLMKFIGPDASYAERFPEWVEV